ncbi:hypothetical protein ZWY2020_057908 [Hordeum vulgare]|nr:hypothetical protein ZWY2020_057908 [Hordeum vulgare]
MGRVRVPRRPAGRGAAEDAGLRVQQRRRLQAHQPSAACFAPDTVKAHCSYAVNSFYQRSQNPLACVFSGTAVLSTVDPSANGCKYPATATPSAPDGPPARQWAGKVEQRRHEDTSGGADVLPAAGTAMRAFVLAGCSLLALYLMA